MTSGLLRAGARSLALLAGSVVSGVALVGLAGAISVGVDGTWKRPGPWVDWRTYANAFERLVHGGSIYAPEQLAGPYMLTHMTLIGYAYPPASVLLFAPFLTYPLGLAAWITLNLGLFLTALWAIVSRGWPRHRVWIFAGLLAALPFMPGFREAVVSGNISLAYAGMVGWVILGVSPIWLAVFGAAGALTKIFPAVLAAAGPTKLRPIGIAVRITLAICLATLPIVGVQAWVDFARAITAATPDCDAQNLSLACTLGGAIGTQPATWLGYAIAGAAGLGLLFVRDRLGTAALAVIVMMAPSANLHVHYWLMVFVLALGTCERLARTRGRLREPVVVRRTA